jgi:hypothetical protein
MLLINKIFFLRLHKLISHFLFCFIALIIGCESHTLPVDNKESISKIANDSEKDTLNKLIYKEGELLNYTTVLPSTDEYSLEINTTYIYDSLFLAERWVADLNEVVTEQKLIFKKNGIAINQFNHNVKKWILDKFGKKRSLLDNVIRTAGLVSAKNGGFYKVEGAGGCNACSEYIGYFSLEGELLYNIYSSQTDNFVNEVGDFDKMIKQFEVPDTLSRLGGKIKVVWIFPPIYSGDIGSSRLK